LLAVREYARIRRDSEKLAEREGFEPRLYGEGIFAR
jgi:hypothetical protein